MNPYFSRMLRAAKLKPALYEEVARDMPAMVTAVRQAPYKTNTWREEN